MLYQAILTGAMRAPSFAVTAAYSVSGKPVSAKPGAAGSLSAESAAAESGL